MAKSLLIVESPAKAKTLKKFLGKDFQVEASSGHLVDLPSNKLGVDVEEGFEPHYVIIKDKKKYLTNLKKAAMDADTIYLASDPDREGEAIAWHIVDQLGLGDRAYRVLFHEITEKAVKEAIEHPGKISQERFEAQQARRILDRLVGYQVSPLLWKKVKKGLSAGRVQSVALKLVVERERAIKAFVPYEHWTIDATLGTATTDEPGFVARLVSYAGEDLKTGDESKIQDETRAREIVEDLQGSVYTVASVDTKSRKKHARPPFITSTLQQEASTKLRFNVKLTMSVAQRLYEGIELGAEGPVGLITYMRTDSVRLSEDAERDARAYIEQKYGREFLPSSPNRFKVKKAAQDAHEAIRPTSTAYPPEYVQKFLTKQQIGLYRLIWNRFLASQMLPAEYAQTTVKVDAGKGIFRANASELVFSGHLKVYIETVEEDTGGDESGEKLNTKLPALSVEEALRLIELEGSQHFTKPPPRFSESSLVKELEERGIGRPSTYAMILSTIQERQYVTREKRQLKPTLLGTAVVDLLQQGFPEVMNAEFTAEMEERLDSVEEGKINWVDLLSTFYKDFSKRLEGAEDAMTSLRREGVPTDISCDLCGKPMIIKWGKKGEFLSCSTYPECKNAKRFVFGPDGSIQVYTKTPPVVYDNVLCEECGKPMALRASRFGKFLGCTGYPDCRGIRKLKDVQELIDEADLARGDSQDGAADGSQDGGQGQGLTEEDQPKRKTIRVTADGRA